MGGSRTYQILAVRNKAGLGFTLDSYTASIAVREGAGSPVKTKAQLLCVPGVLTVQLPTALSSASAYDPKYPALSRPSLTLP